MKTSSAPLVTLSVTMLLCGFYNTIFNILRRASHFIGTVREAAQLNTDYTDPAEWKNIAVSLYDLLVVVRLSSCILAAFQFIAAAAGLIFAALYAFRKKPPKGTWLPALLGVICTLAGAVSVASTMLTGSAGRFLTAVLFITEVLVPLLFLIFAVRFRRGVTKGEITQ